MLRRAANAVFWGAFLLMLGTVVGGSGWFIREHAKPVTVILETSVLEGPRQAIVLRFSQTMRPGSFAGKISIAPDVSVQTTWHDWGKELVITPESNWPLESNLSLFLGTGQSRFFSRSDVQTFSIVGPRYPSVVSLEPTDGARDVVLGVEDPIRVTLDRSARDFFLDFRLDPPAPVVYQNNPEKTSFEILPKENLIAGREYRLEIWARWRSEPDEKYHLLAVSRFAARPPAPATWNRDLALRTEEAKRFTRPKKTEGKYIDINLASQIMTLFENGQVLDAYVISSGKRGMETPRGEFAIANKADRPWSKRYSLYMPYWQAIVPSGLFGIHELPEWPGGYKEGANHLGTPVSHGCVRLGVGPAKRVYEWTDIGTPVVVY